jgi:hypothetical protein
MNFVFDYLIMNLIVLSIISIVLESKIEIAHKGVQRFTGYAQSGTK